jgi:hypothetical protein
MKNRYLNINAALASEVLRRGVADEFRTLLALKGVAKGGGAYFEVTPKLLNKLRGLCGWRCQRTPKRKIRKLLQMGWVGRDSSGTLYVRSFSYLLNQFDVRSSAVHKLSVPWICESKQKVKAALFSIATGKIIANRQYALVRKNSAHTSTGTCWKASFDPAAGETFSPDALSVSFLAKRFEVSKATVHRWKHRAIDEGLIEREKRRFEFSGVTDVKAIRSAFPEHSHRTYLFFDSGSVAVQLTDKLSSTLQYKSRQQ